MRANLHATPPNRRSRWSRRSSLVALALAGGLTHAVAGDLSPFAAPAQRAPAVQESAAPTMSAERRKFYADFKREMGALPRAQRNAMKAEFERKRDAAVTTDEKTHYQRLVIILSDM